MKQFRCADIVPGCSAAVRARNVDEVISTSLGHLTSVHQLDASTELHLRVRQRVTTVNPLRALFARS